MHARRRVVLTRSPEDNARLRALAADLDVDWVERTCIAYELQPIPRRVIDDLRAGRFDAAVFPSRRAVEGLFQAGPLPDPPRVVAVGPSTRDALTSHGWRDAVMPSETRAAAFVDELDTLLPGARSVLYVRGETATDDIQTALRSRGAVVTEVVVYRSRPVAIEPLPDDDVPTLVVLASPEAACAWLATDATNREYLAIGTSTAAAIRKGGHQVRVAAKATANGLEQAVRAWAGEHWRASRGERPLPE